MKNPTSITDQNLYQLCQKYGTQTLLARKKFAGLLPEVYKRKLFEKKGFGSIYEFAAKLAGMSKQYVNLILNLEKRFQDKPILKKALTNGEISANKLTRIVSIATRKNQEELCETAKKLSKNALATFVKDMRGNNKNDCQKPLNAHICLPGQTYEINENIKNRKNSNFNKDSKADKSLDLDEDIKAELKKLQNKGININEFLRNALKERQNKINKEKRKLALEEENKEKSSRHIPIKIKKVLYQEYGAICSHPNCNRPADRLHHTRRFALVPNHNPYFIAPLCSRHHEIAHKIDQKYTRKTQLQTLHT